jgi:hypothetical protein
MFQPPASCEVPHSSYLHTGHVLVLSAHGLRQGGWKACLLPLQGSTTTLSPTARGSMHTGHADPGPPSSSTFSCR